MADNVVIEAFTELAPRYEEVVDRELREFWGLGYREFVNRLINTIPIDEGDVVLDVATGTAIIPLEIADKVGTRGQVVGLDITLAMLQHGHRNVKASGSTSHIRLVCASAMAMPFIESSFDVVICGLGMHHMDVPQMLFEMRRVLKRGGSLIMADVGASALWSFFGARWAKLLIARRYGPIQESARAKAEMEAFPNVRTAEEWRSILSKFGFIKAEINKIRPRLPWYPWGLFMRAVAEGA